MQPLNHLESQISSYKYSTWCGVAMSVVLLTAAVAFAAIALDYQLKLPDLWKQYGETPWPFDQKIMESIREVSTQGWISFGFSVGFLSILIGVALLTRNSHLQRRELEAQRPS